MKSNIIRNALFATTTYNIMYSILMYFNEIDAFPVDDHHIAMHRINSMTQVKIKLNRTNITKIINSKKIDSIIKNV